MLFLIGQKPPQDAYRRFQHASAPGRRSALAAVWMLCLLSALSAPAREAPAVRGVPFTRTYSLEDIGHVPRGSRLGFDRFGRVAVIHDAVYTVLNDSVWLNLALPGGSNRISMSNVVEGPDGHSYYGARASWGRIETGTDGRLHPVPLVGADPPNWITAAVFTDVIVTADGVYFASWNGVVFRSFKEPRNLTLEVPRVSRFFRVGQRVYVSCYGSRLRYIDLASGTLQPAAETLLDDNVIEFATPLDATRSLVALLDGWLGVFDGQTVTPWLPADRNGSTGDIAAMQQLVDGRIAIAVTGQGLRLFSAEGDLLMSLTTSQYHNITALANREPGVLWVATDDAVEKIFYGSPLSAFGQRLGLPIAWPIVVSWNGRIMVASDGRLYQAVAGDHSKPTHFELAENQPPGGAWALAAWGSHLLIGNVSNLFAADADGVFRPLPPVGELVHLVMTDPDHCYAIGRSEIALLEYRDGRWIEPSPRISGVRNPAIVHRIGDSAWAEMGGDGVARVWRREGRLQLDILRNETWTKASWVNVGAVGQLAVLSSLRDEPRRFFDHKTGAWCDAPELTKLLDRSPYWVARMQEGADGVIWATHNEGLIRFAPKGRDYEMDANSFDLVSDRYPVVRILPEGGVWVAAERALYRVEPSWISPPSQVSPPTLVSVINLQDNEELLTGAAPPKAPLRLPYAKNSLSFRFFSGTDAWRRAPVYEYRLGDQDAWTMFDGSLLSLRGLVEGSYRLQVRVAGQGEAQEASLFAFEILAPWHRSRLAYFVFGSLAIALLIGVSRWSNYLERRRNRLLEQVVQDRTRELESAISRLGEETRRAATLAERDRLANEIHDSVQQGLTGAILQIDSTLKSSPVSSDLNARLILARNMVSHARQEVQHAVWDMESPLLEGTELADALRNLTTFVDSGAIAIEVTVEGSAVALGRTINHNLLRIAQEATTNAVRHAQARKIALRLKYDANQVSLEITDDGVGFQPSEVMHDNAGHLGLRGIRGRVKKLRGKVTIDSSPGHGTAIAITVPMTAVRDFQNHGDDETA